MINNTLSSNKPRATGNILCNTCLIVSTFDKKGNQHTAKVIKTTIPIFATLPILPTLIITINTLLFFFKK